MLTADDVEARLEESNVELHGAGVIPWSYSGDLISAGTGLSVDVADFKALIGYVIDYTSLSPVSVPASATTPVWAKQSGASPIVAQSTDPSTSTNPAIRIGEVTTDATGVTGVNNGKRVFLPSVLNVRLFGAKGDGVSDDTSAIQAAIDAAEEVYDSRELRADDFYAGLAVYFPGGVYVTDETLEVTQPVTLRGDGMTASVIKGTGNDPVVTIKLTKKSEYKSPTLENLGIFGDTSQADQDGVKLEWDAAGNPGTRAVLNSVLIQHCGRHGFYSENRGINNTLQDCVIQYNKGEGILLEGIFNTSFVIERNVIRGNRRGIRINPNSGSSFTTGIIKDNLIESNRYGDDGQLGTSTLPACGIQLAACSVVTIEGNYFESHLNDIYAEGAVSLCAIKNNHFDVGSNKVPTYFDSLQLPPARRLSPLYFDNVRGANTGNIVEENHFYQPKKPVTYDDGSTPFPNALWGLEYDEVNTGAVTGMRGPNSITLTSGNVSTMGIVAGSYVSISGITGTNIAGINGNTYRVEAVNGETLTLYGGNFSGTYSSGGTVKKVLSPSAGITAANSGAQTITTPLSLSVGNLVSISGAGNLNNINGNTYRVSAVSLVNPGEVTLEGPAFTGTYTSGGIVTRVYTPEMYEHISGSVGRQSQLLHNLSVGPSGSLEDVQYASDSSGNVYFSGVRSETGFNKSRERAYELAREAAILVRDKASTFDEEGNSTLSAALHRMIWPTGLSTDYVHQFLPYRREADGSLALVGAGWGLDSSGNFSIPFQGKISYQKVSGQLITRDWGAAAPSTGAWLQGSVRWNQSPTSGSPLGWICVTGGSPGTWAPFGVQLDGSNRVPWSAMAANPTFTTKITDTVSSGAGFVLAKSLDADRNFLRWNQGTGWWQSGFRASPYKWVLEWQVASSPADDSGWTQAIVAATNGIVDLPNGLQIGTGTLIAKHLSATATWNPPSTADGAYTSATVTVTGAAVGDTVAVGFSQAVPAGAMLTGAVTAADTVTVTLFNKTGSALDLASGTLRADVWKH